MKRYALFLAVATTMFFMFVGLIYPNNASASPTVCGPTKDVTGRFAAPFAEVFGQVDTQLITEPSNEPLKIVATTPQVQSFISMFNFERGSGVGYTFTVQQQEVSNPTNMPSTKSPIRCDWVLVDVKGYDGESLEWDVTKLPLQNFGNSFSKASTVPVWLKIHKLGAVFDIEFDAGPGGFEVGMFYYNSITKTWSATLVQNYRPQGMDHQKETYDVTFKDGALVAIDPMGHHDSKDYGYLWFQRGNIVVLENIGSSTTNSMPNALWTIPHDAYPQSGWSVAYFMITSGTPIFIDGRLYYQPPTNVTHSVIEMSN